MKQCFIKYLFFSFSWMLICQIYSLNLRFCLQLLVKGDFSVCPRGATDILLDTLVNK